MPINHYGEEDPVIKPSIQGNEDFRIVTNQDGHKVGPWFTQEDQSRPNVRDESDWTVI